MKAVFNPKYYIPRKGNIIETNHRSDRDRIRSVEASGKKLHLEFHEQEIENMWLIWGKFL